MKEKGQMEELIDKRITKKEIRNKDFVKRNNKIKEC